MLAFQVELNRKKVATAGIVGPHVLTAVFSSVIRDGEARRLWPRGRKSQAKELTFSLGGMISHSSGAKEHVDWACLDLKIGDTVTLKVVDAALVDEPVRRRRTEAPSIEKRERLELDRLQKKYLGR